MQLDNATLYAIAVLRELDDARDILGNEDLARKLNMAFGYVNRITTNLSKAGLVTSRRGPGGGFRIAKPARDIPFVDLLEAMDGGLLPDIKGDTPLLRELRTRSRAVLADWFKGLHVVDFF